VKLDADQLEWIVREVVRRLRSDPPLPPGEGWGEGAPSTSSHLVLKQSLITTATLERNLAGVTSVGVPPRAVVTPAARDLLRERGIELVRSEGRTP
jgi:hypothetical protein